MPAAWQAAGIFICLTQPGRRATATLISVADLANRHDKPPAASIQMMMSLNSCLRRARRVHQIRFKGSGFRFILADPFHRDITGFSGLGLLRPGSYQSVR